jgi:hypothetical protein
VITAVSPRLWNLTFQQMRGWVLLMARTAATTNVEQPAGVAAGGHRAPPHQRDTRAGLLVQMLVHRSWTSRPVAGTVGPVMRIDGHAALTLPQAARWLGLTVPCVNALIARGELASLRDPDGSVRISAASLIEWAGTAGRGDPPPAPQ